MNDKVRELKYYPICDDCVKGIGEECHNPTCAYCRSDVPPKMTFPEFGTTQVALSRVKFKKRLPEIIEEWKWGFKDKAPFYCNEKEANNPLIPNLRKEDMEYLFRAVNKLSQAIMEEMEGE